MISEKNIRCAENDIFNILFELGLINSIEDKLDTTQNIYNSLGLDSQEIATLATRISSLAIFSKSIEVSDIKNLNDIIIYLAVHRDHWLHKDVPFTMQDSIILNNDFATVFSLINEYQRWPEILNHILKVEKNINVGRLQNFIMQIEDSTTGKTYFVETCRYVDEISFTIDFSQTIPPQGFKCHKGGWRFQSLGKNRTRLITFHGFSLLPDESVEKAILLIRKHIKAALTTWSHYGIGGKNA